MSRDVSIVGNAKEGVDRMATSQREAARMIEQLLTVRQIRQYQPLAVPEDDLETLLQVARWTGSSRNTQPWHFIVVREQDVLSRISRLRTPINWVADAPLAIALVLNGANDIQEAYDEGRVTERIMIAAKVLGLGAGVAWFGNDEQEAEAKRILGIPAERTAHSVVTIGYAVSARDPRPNRAQGGRKPLSELVSYERLGRQG